MFDTATIGAALTSAKVILELARNANDAQLAMRISVEIANLQGKLIDVQQQAMSLQEENQELRDEVRELRRAAREESHFLFVQGVYWKQYEAIVTDNEETSRTQYEGPFCPICKDADGKAVRLRASGNHDFWCDIHKLEFNVPMRPS